jgi:predicted AAA+ superfamily ATPase
MFKRELTQKFQQLAKKFPILALIGPRQSGKSTLARMVFPNYKYVSLEDLDQREFATNDPRNFLETYNSGVIIDEAQLVPSLFSYLQTYVDQHNEPGQFILTGSQNFLLSEKINQSLAGRVAFLTLLPLSLQELVDDNHQFDNYEQAIYQGFYPRIYDKQIAPIDWYPNYIRTYIERDVREIKNILDIGQFQLFLKMCASRVGQLVNLSALANDCGITEKTAKSWLALLEQSFIIFTLKPFHENLGKRLVKMPKLYFYDTGVVCSLLGIDDVNQITTHYAKGVLFENLIIAELMKTRFNEGLLPNLYFWRDKLGHEIDCVIEQANKTILVEIKSGRTISTDYFTDLKYWQKLADSTTNEANVIYGGDENQIRGGIRVLSWDKIKELL